MKRLFLSIVILAILLPACHSESHDTNQSDKLDTLSNSLLENDDSGQELNESTAENDAIIALIEKAFNWYIDLPENQQLLLDHNGDEFVFVQKDAYLTEIGNSDYFTDNFALTLEEKLTECLANTNDDLEPGKFTCEGIEPVTGVLMDNLAYVDIYTVSQADDGRTRVEISVFGYVYLPEMDVETDVSTDLTVFLFGEPGDYLIDQVEFGVG